MNSKKIPLILIGFGWLMYFLALVITVHEIKCLSLGSSGTLFIVGIIFAFSITIKNE